ncbi:MAG TPA: hypothetical protein VIL36_05805 [Acidimicrobiales bacterium]
MGRVWGRRCAGALLVGALALGLTGCSPPLDTTFGGGDGIATTRAFWTGWHAPRAVHVQPDGRIVVLTEVSLAATLTALVRFEPDGTLDQTFGDGGVVVTDHTVTYRGCSDLALAPDGGYLVVVDTPDAEEVVTPGVVRYHADGTPDTAFGDDGIARTTSGYPCGLDVLPDGRIVAGGIGEGGAVTARWTADGQPDPTYGGDGLGEAFPTPPWLQGVAATAVEVQPDGGVVAVGDALHRSTGDLNGIVLRYRADGTLDPDFGDGDGVTVTDATPGGLQRVAVRPDGRVVVLGNQRPYAAPDGRGFLVAQLTAAGTLDPTFGGGDGVTTALDDATARDLALLPDGDVLLVGGTAPGGVHDGFLLARFTPDGALDADYGDRGVGTTDVFPTDEAAYAMAVQPDGKLVVAGSVGDDNPAVVGSLLGVYRYEAAAG